MTLTEQIDENRDKAIEAAEDAVDYMQRGWWGSAQQALADAEQFRKAADAAAAAILWDEENL